ncbi:MAG: benzoate-CoA ligase family protein [Thermoanaerobaculia bacterium]|nr:MAG: benzoate-CoA ligase family protein [Thermoanaerobaculia bacterium]
MTFVPPEELNLADWLVDARVREGAGERVALRLPDRELTYRDVQRLAHRFGNVLAGLGLRPEERVLLALPDGAELVGALFGALAAGASVVLLNPELGADEIAGLVDYLRPRFAVIEGGLAPVFAEALARARERLALVTVGAAAPGCPSYEELARTVAGELAAVRTHRDDPAVWLFSGGTTGRPKAVVQSHGSYAFTTVAYGQRTLGLSASDVTLSVPKLFFGYALGSNLFFPFSVGASACLFAGKATADAIFAAVRRHRPTVLVNVPTMVHQMVSHPGAAAQDLSCLRLATSAGEALPEPLLERWQATFGVELLDGLGTAEQWHVFVTNRPGEVRPGTLGRAVEGFEVRVRDEEGRDLPDGEIGWLWVRGGARAWGYWREMAKTQATFRGEWVVTGDLVSRDTEGIVTYHGRGDDALKVAGRWFSPAEVESCLARHPAVAECAVVGVPDESGLTKPHAWVIARHAGEGLARELSDFVARKLQPYKAPRVVHLVAELPRTHLGKIDRGALKRRP